MLDVHSIGRKEVEKACMDEQGLLTKIKQKKESYKRWEQDRNPRRNTNTHSEHAGKARLSLELNLMRNVKDTAKASTGTL